MSQAHVALIEQSWRTWEETGEPAWDLLDDEVATHDHDIMDAGEYRGRKGVERWLQDWGAAWAEFSIEPEEFIDAGERVVAVVRMRASGRDSSAPVERQDAIVYEIRGGKILRLDYYNNRQQALASVGMGA